MKDNSLLMAHGHLLCYKMPQKESIFREGLNLVISLILHNKALFHPLGMKIAERSMTMVSELRRGIEQD